MSSITIRNLTSYDDFKQVLALEQQVWGFSDPYDMVPPVVFTITVKRGAILLGARARLQRNSTHFRSIRGTARAVLAWFRSPAMTCRCSTRPGC